MVQAIALLLGSLTDDAGRIPSYYRVWCHVLRYHGPRPYYRPLTDTRARQHQGTVANPRPLADHHVPATVGDIRRP